MTWKTKTFAELCKMYQPQTLSKKQLKPEGKYFVYGANGVIGKYDKYNHEESQLLITCRGATCGSINISEPFSWINGNAMIIQPNENEISKKYLEYFIRGLINFSKIITGSAQPQITRESLNPILVSYPSLAEQGHITARLDTAFAEIDRYISNISKTENHLTFLKKNYLKKIINDKKYQWKHRTLSEISINLDNKRIPITKSKRNQGKIPYYGASGIVDYVSDWIFDDDLLLISEDGANLLMRTYPIAFKVNGKCWVNNHAHVLKFKDKNLQYWVEKYLNSIDLSEYITGMAQPKLNQLKLNIIKIPVPTSSIENLINKFKSFEERFELLSLQINKKKKLINSLKLSILKKELIKAA